MYTFFHAYLSPYQSDCFQAGSAPGALVWINVYRGISRCLVIRHLRAKKPYSAVKNNQVDDLIFFCAIGVVLGGRIGYMVFYAFSDLLANPLSLFQVWNGGMSFHG